MFEEYTTQRLVAGSESPFVTEQPRFALKDLMQLPSLGCGSLRFGVEYQRRRPARKSRRFKMLWLAVIIRSSVVRSKRDAISWILSSGSRNTSRITFCMADGSVPTATLMRFMLNRRCSMSIFARSGVAAVATISNVLRMTFSGAVVGSAR